MHDTNKYVYDMCGTEEGCNNAIIDPEFASREAQVVQGGEPSPQGIGP